MADVGRTIYVGAEADLVEDSYLGLAAVAKIRKSKAYRHPELDRRLRRERTRAEALLIAEAARAGVPVPSVLDIDAPAGTLRLSRVGGERLRDVLLRDATRGRGLSATFGGLLGRLHAAGLVHGDPTTSNVHVEGDELVLLDFGLAGRSAEVEDRGVDLHLAERTFEAGHPGHTDWFQAFLDGYRSAGPDAAKAVERMNEIKARARYV